MARVVRHIVKQNHTGGAFGSHDPHCCPPARNRKGQFLPGVSGHTPGRTKGTRNKSTQMAAAMLEGGAEAIVRKVVELALGGDVTCLKLCLERIIPSLRQVE